MKLGKRVKHLYHRADYSVGKKVFGNTIGVSNNIKGSLKNAQGGSNIENVSDPRINELRKNQYLVLHDHYDEKLIETIRKKYNEIIEDDEKSYRSSLFEGKSYSSHIKNIYEEIEEIGQLISSQIKTIVEGYYQSYFDIKYIEGWRNKYVPKEVELKSELFSNHWHCDNRSTEYLKLFVPLVDISEDDGPFHIMSQDRTKQLIKTGYGSRDDYNLQEEVINDPNHMMKVTGKAGMAYFGNPQLCLHRAGVPSKDHWRDMIDFVFAPSSIPLSENWFENFKPDDKYYKATHNK